jgi:hypothetical protein
MATSIFSCQLAKLQYPHKNYGKIENLSEFDLEKYFPFKILENILQPKI